MSPPRFSEPELSRVKVFPRRKRKNAGAACQDPTTNDDNAYPPTNAQARERSESASTALAARRCPTVSLMPASKTHDTHGTGLMLSVRDIKSFFHMRQTDAASRMGISLTALKAACRRVGITRWPYSRLRGKDGGNDCERHDGALTHASSPDTDPSAPHLLEHMSDDTLGHKQALSQLSHTLTHTHQALDSIQHQLCAPRQQPQHRAYACAASLHLGSPSALHHLQVMQVVSGCAHQALVAYASAQMMQQQQQASHGNIYSMPRASRGNQLQELNLSLMPLHCRHGNLHSMSSHGNLHSMSSHTHDGMMSQLSMSQWPEWSQAQGGSAPHGMQPAADGIGSLLQGQVCMFRGGMVGARHQGVAGMLPTSSTSILPSSSSTLPSSSTYSTLHDSTLWTPSLLTPSVGQGLLSTRPLPLATPHAPTSTCVPSYKAVTRTSHTSRHTDTRLDTQAHV